MYYDVIVIENPAYKGIMTVVLNKGARFPWKAYVNFQGGESPNVFYNTFFINFKIYVFSPIVWLSLLKYCLRYYCD